MGDSQAAAQQNTAELQTQPNPAVQPEPAVSARSGDGKSGFDKFLDGVKDNGWLIGGLAGAAMLFDSGFVLLAGLIAAGTVVFSGVSEDNGIVSSGVNWVKKSFNGNGRSNVLPVPEQSTAPSNNVDKDVNKGGNDGKGSSVKPDATPANEKDADNTKFKPSSVDLTDQKNTASFYISTAGKALPEGGEGSIFLAGSIVGDKLYVQNYKFVGKDGAFLKSLDGKADLEAHYTGNMTPLIISKDGDKKTLVLDEAAVKNLEPVTKSAKEVFADVAEREAKAKAKQEMDEAKNFATNPLITIDSKEAVGNDTDVRFMLKTGDTNQGKVHSYDIVGMMKKNNSGEYSSMEVLSVSENDKVVVDKPFSVPLSGLASTTLEGLNKEDKYLPDADSSMSKLPIAGKLDEVIRNQIAKKKADEVTKGTSEIPTDWFPPMLTPQQQQQRAAASQTIV